MKTEIAKGWALRVGGSKPYLAWGQFEYDKKKIKCWESYHRAVKAVLVPLEEYHRLKGKRR